MDVFCPSVSNVKMQFGRVLLIYMDGASLDIRPQVTK